MLTRTYITNYNTIIRGSHLNVGLNPVSELVYGKNLTRMLVYFDHSKLAELVKDKTIVDMSKVKHVLKITNAGSIDHTQLHCGDISSISSTPKIRTSSFDLIFFLIPKKWDSGKGFDYTRNFFNTSYYAKNCPYPINTAKLTSVDGCNWYQARNGYPWDEEGIYSNETLSKEYDKYGVGSGSTIIIGRQHFNYGDENISLDITDIVNKYINGELENNGIGVAFTPMTELIESDVENYVGFLTDKTPSYFEPYIETTYDDCITDDRAYFILNKKNKLFLYSNIGGKTENLDELPTCSVDGKDYEVKQLTKGVYYIDIVLNEGEYQPNTMYYDTWSNIKYQGKSFNDVELEFTTKPSENWFNIGNSLEMQTTVTPSVSGIKENEKIKRGDKRKLTITAKVDYKTSTVRLIDDMEYRLYIKDGTRELDIIPWERVNQSYLENFVVIDTNILVPQRYYVDVKIKYNFQEIIHHNTLSFKIVDDLNNKYN